MTSTISARVRQAVLEFDRAAEQVSVQQFCHDRQISTSSFYRLRAQAAVEGAGQVLRARSRAPLNLARRYGRFTVEAVIATRAALQGEGLDCGPWSIWWRLDQQGVPVLPSRSTIARILRVQGLVTADPRKRPRSSWRRWQRSLANELWQLDGMEWVYGDGQPVTIYQVVDDCTRVCVGLHAEPGGERFEGAKTTLEAAFTRWERPAAVLTDNARAFNQHRFGQTAPLENWLAEQGIRPISGSPHHPQTQGKTERSHQTLQRWLLAHPSSDVTELNQSLDSFATLYNQQRQHQGLGPRITPMMAWNTVGKAGPARHRLDLAELYGQPLQLPPPPAEPSIGHGTIYSNGTLRWQGIELRFGIAMAGELVHFLTDGPDLEIYDHQGELHAVVPWPPPTKRVSLVRPPYLRKPPPTVSQKS